jgi:hypothetical protein
MLETLSDTLSDTLGTWKRAGEHAVESCLIARGECDRIAQCLFLMSAVQASMQQNLDAAQDTPVNGQAM